MVDVEVCINGDEVDETRSSVTAANAGGAARIELCGGMQFDGLTPPVECIQAARDVFEPKGLLVMIRPRAGDFQYSPDEVELIKLQISAAAAAGADGVVMGLLNEVGDLDLEPLRELVGLSQSLGLMTTFHRAFDAARDRLEALDALIELGFDRVLTSGVTWGMSGSALDGVLELDRLIQAAKARLEIVIGGGVNPVNAPQVLRSLSPWDGKLSVHAYSGVQDKENTTVSGVKALVDAVANF
jgi:copper homeostasis protein